MYNGSYLSLYVLYLFMGHTNNFKIRKFTDLQPMLVLMSLSNGSALAIKRRSSYLIQWTSRVQTKVV